MSAWSIGAGTTITASQGRAVGAREAATDRVSPADAPTVDSLAAWIPGEVIAGYMALVVALQGNNSDAVIKPTSKWWLVGAIATAGILTFLGAFSKTGNLTRNQSIELGVKVVLSAIAFTIWSLALPGSAWQSIDKIASNAAAVAIVAGIGATVFGLLAQGIVVRLPKDSEHG